MTDTTPRLEQVIADFREEAKILRRNGYREKADAFELVCDQVAKAATEWLDWLSEDEARSRSGWGVDRLRRWFPLWLEIGAAEIRDSRRRFYRAAVIPMRVHLDTLRAEGFRAGAELREKKSA